VGDLKMCALTISLNLSWIIGYTDFFTVFIIFCKCVSACWKGTWLCGFQICVAVVV